MITNKIKQEKISNQLGNEHKKFALKKTLVLAVTFLLLFGSVYLIFRLQPHFENWKTERLDSLIGQIIFYITLLLLTIKILYLLYISYLYFKYKPIKSVNDKQLLNCTIIVPAYNEGKLVYETLLSIDKSDYPSHKIQLIAIDDGSKDDTWFWMNKAKLELGDRLDIYQQPENKGKRQALYRGFNLGNGEIFVTIDSDSIIKPDTLRNMVSPFVKNSQCGAVAGNVKVLNQNTALIPKMLNVSFAFSFEFVRSAQSMLGSVLCTPGALSAYRKEAVMNCLNDWLAQTFMGQPSDIGEDRAMTNMILKQGYHVLFQQNAIVYTNIPEKFPNLYRMFIRWERSNVRENISMTKFAFTDFRLGSKTGTRIVLLDQWLKLIFAYPLTILMLLFLIKQPILFTISTLFGILIFSSVQAIFYAKKHEIKESFWAYPYSLFYAFTLFWITPYAIATAGKSGWLTRELSQKE